MKISILALCIGALFLSGCGTLTAVDNMGKPEGKIVWPDVDKVTLDHHRGSYADMNRISLIKNGVTRDEIYQSIGRPQFSEGFHVREWDYVFYFTQKDGTELTCQYKILFDDKLIARNFYWRTVSPVGAHCPPSQYIDLSMDTLFRFDGGSINDLLPGGIEMLKNLIHNLKGSQVKSIDIYGYTDRLGTSAYNQKLSSQRAQAIKSYLTEHGLNVAMHSQGMGEVNPVVNCRKTTERTKLIQCLQPNRRVEIKVNR